jgi:hypothetical protein
VEWFKDPDGNILNIINKCLTLLFFIFAIKFIHFLASRF